MNNKNNSQLIIYILLFLLLSLYLFLYSCSVKAEEVTPIKPAITYYTLLQQGELPEIEEQEEENTLTSLGVFKITYYCNCEKCCGKWAGGPTASGEMPIEGVTIAVDTDIIKLGATILIDNHEYIAQDTGSAIQGNIIDIYLSSHEDCIQRGVNYKEVFINY